MSAQEMKKKRFITSDLPVVEVCLVALSHPTPPDCAAENKLPVDFEGCGIRETPEQEMRSTVPGLGEVPSNCTCTVRHWLAQSLPQQKAEGIFK